MKKIILPITILSIAFATYSCKKDTSNKSQEIDANNRSIAQNNIAETPIVAENQIKKNPEDYPVISLEETDFSLGNMIQGDKVEHISKFKNTGKTNLIITDVRASCGCTVPEWPKQEIKPGESGEVKIVFNSTGKMGEQHKSITIMANTETGSQLIYFTANIKPKK